MGCPLGLEQRSARSSEQGTSAEMIGDAIAPRTTYEAVYEGHRQARKL